MEPLKWEFYFEHGPIVLDEGILFEPLKDAVRRWSRVTKFGLVPGINFELLYEMKDGRYASFSYQGCAEIELVNKDTKEKKKVWRGQLFSYGVQRPWKAKEFIEEIGGTVPEALEKVVEEENRRFQESIEERFAERERESIPQPLEYWKDHSELLIRCSAPIDEVDYKELARTVYYGGVELIQALRTYDQSDDINRGWLDKLRSVLFCETRVDIDFWWGNEDTIPPEYIPMLDLPWPQELKSTRTKARELRNLIELPCHCLASGIGYPDATLFQAEKRPRLCDDQAALNRLNKHINRIEKIVVSIGKKLRELALVGRDISKEPSPSSTLPRRVLLALNSYEMAETALLEQGIDSVTDEMAHDWLQDNAPEEYDLPEKENWLRYLREARQKTGQKKNAPRGGRTGRSIVSSREIE